MPTEGRWTSSEELSARAPPRRVAGAVSPDIVSFNALLEACSPDDNLRVASELLSRVSHIGLDANIATFTALMSIALQQGRPDVVCDVWGCLRASQVEPDKQSIDLYLQALVAQVRMPACRGARMDRQFWREG